MYLFNTKDIVGVSFLKRPKLWRFRLRCGAAVKTSFAGVDPNEVCADSELPLVDCIREGCLYKPCLVEVREDD